MNRRLKSCVVVLFVIYMALLIWIILFKLQFSISDLDTLRSVNMIPFYYDNEIGAEFHVKEILENTLIFVPLGIYLQMLLFERKLYVKLIMIAGTSFLLETAQYVLAIGRSDITDLLTNTAGGLLGIVLYFIVVRLLKNRVRANKLFFTFAVIISVAVIVLLALLLISN